jgi:hypothetical protein
MTGSSIATPCRRGVRSTPRFKVSKTINYLSEYYLLETFARALGTIKLDGRADGIILGGEFPIVDEIKSTVEPLREVLCGARGVAPRPS